ncbi:MAG: hypothetical protein C0404_05410 [Verrucomicrobia bacterium]|nr:hypothetical protein [Verrucomicrobiota bacterium]
MRGRTMLVGAMLVLATGFCACGEPAPEALLPVHEDRDAYDPGSAFGNDVFLVVWQSGRLAPGDIRNGPVGIGDIVGCRVDKSGKALDAKPLVISGAKDLQERPFVTFGGGVFLVVWQDLRNGKDYDVCAARVSPDGKVLDPDGITVSGGAHNQAEPRVAWDGKTFVVVWSDFRSGDRYEVFGARVSADGKVLDQQGIPISSDKYLARSPAVASAGNGKSMVLWIGATLTFYEGRCTLCSGAFLEDGKVASPVQRYVGGDNRNEDGPSATGSPVCLAAGGQTYLCAWKNETPVGRGIPRDSANAGVFDQSGKRTKWFCLDGKPRQRVFDTAVSWDGSRFAATWDERRCVGDPYQGNNSYHVVFASRVSAEGEPDGKPVQLSGSFESPAAKATVASDGAGATLVAYEKHPVTGDVPIKIGFRMLPSK